MLGLAIATATVHNPAYAQAYETNAVGGLLGQVLFPHLGTFGKFCLVILALSIIGNNCPNIYSLTFSLQILTHYAQLVPRFIWTFVGTGIYIAIAIPGYSHFESVLENFMLVIVSATILSLRLRQLTETRATGLLSMKGSHSPSTSSIAYERSATPKKHMINLESCHPPLQHYSLFALVSWERSWACHKYGLLVSLLLLLQEARKLMISGPIGKLIGEPPFGGDIGFELAFAFSSTTYTVFRYFELKYFKR